MEYRIVWPDGTERIVWAEAGELTLDDEGNPFTLTGIVQDITERVIAEGELRISEQSLARSQQIAGMGSWLCSYETGEFTWSDGLYAIYGHEKRTGDNIREMWLDTVHPDDKERMNDLDEKFKAGECDYDTEYRIIRHDTHEVRIIHAIAEVVRNDQGVRGPIDWGCAGYYGP